jgi:hypothetical protein
MNFLTVTNITFAGYDKQSQILPHVAIEINGVANEVAGRIKMIFEGVVRNFAATDYFDELHHYVFPDPSSGHPSPISLHFLMATFKGNLAGNVEGRDLQAMHILATQIRAHLQRHAL